MVRRSPKCSNDLRFEPFHLDMAVDYMHLVSLRAVFCIKVPDMLRFTVEMAAAEAAEDSESAIFRRLKSV